MKRTKMIAALAVSVTATAIVAGVSAENLKSNVFAADVTYTIDFDGNYFNQGLGNGNFNVVTKAGSNIAFYYSDVGGMTSFCTLNPDGKIINRTQISGLKSIDIDFVSDSIYDELTIQYGWEDTFLPKKTTITADAHTLDLTEEKPGFFKITNEGPFPIRINSVSLNYTCEASDIPSSVSPDDFLLTRPERYSDITDGGALAWASTDALDDNDPYFLFIPETARYYNGGYRTVTEISDSFATSANLLSHVKNIYLPDTLKSINMNAFGGWLLENVRLPSGLKLIDSRAFRGTKLKTVELPSSLEFLLPESFGGIESLEKVFVPAGVPSKEFYPTAFLGCPNATIYFEDETIPEHLSQQLMTMEGGMPFVLGADRSCLFE